MYCRGKYIVQRKIIGIEHNSSNFFLSSKNISFMTSVYIFDQKILVQLYWKGWLQPTTPWRGLTTDRHGSFWLLGFPSGPVRLSLDNLVSLGSPKKTMLMPILVQTPIQHVPGVTRAPRLTLFQYLTSRTQDYKSSPHSRPEDDRGKLPNLFWVSLGISFAFKSNTYIIHTYIIPATTFFFQFQFRGGLMGGGSSPLAETHHFHSTYLYLIFLEKR